MEVADLGQAIAVRDSKNPDHGALLLIRSQWAAFLTDVKAGLFDRR